MRHRIQKESHFWGIDHKLKAADFLSISMFEFEFPHLDVPLIFQRDNERSTRSVPSFLLGSSFTLLRTSRLEYFQSEKIKLFSATAPI